MKNILITLALSILAITFVNAQNLKNVKFTEKDYVPKFAIKIEPLQAIVLAKYRIGVEASLSHKTSIEIEGGIQSEPNYFDFNLRKDPTKFNVTIRYKNFIRTKSEISRGSAKNPLNGVYFAPVFSFGDSARIDGGDNAKQSASNTYGSALLDLGMQVVGEGFLFDIYCGAGVSFNEFNNEFSLNYSHLTYNYYAFRMGVRMGWQFKR